MNNLEIVVAYYNNKNFIKLLDKFSNFFMYKKKAIIYNKSNNKLVLKNKYNQKFLKNIGREGETYLNHIINNYDNLSEYTFFIQDDTDNHIPNYISFIKFCNNFIRNKNKFTIYPCTWRKGSKKVYKRTIKNGIYRLPNVPSEDSVKMCCKENNIFLPKKYTTQTCAFFICHKKAILNHKKDFYIKLRKWLLRNPTNGFVLEHVWKLIFSDNLVS